MSSSDSENHSDAEVVEEKKQSPLRKGQLFYLKKKIQKSNQTEQKSVKNPYNSESEDEDKYLDARNVDFAQWKKDRQKEHILKLWRKCIAKTTAIVIMQMQLSYVKTKIDYFGRQMLSHSCPRSKFKYSKMLVIMPDNKWLSIWNYIIILLLFYIAIFSTYISAFIVDQ